MATVSFSIPVAEASSSTAAPVPRPVTSKARGVCKYYKDPRGCYAKDKCKFLHSEPLKEGDPPVLTPYDSSKTCRFYLQGYCKRGDKCWFRHTESKDKGKNPATLDEEDDICSICFEKPITYGLLAGCNHVFCTTCIAQWRDPIKKSGSAIESGNIKRCPMCREPSRFITPSSRFWRHGTSEKNKTIMTYRESMARVQCRYFQKSLAKDKNKPLCPYGKECFYQHKKEDGTLHEFKDGVEVSQRVVVHFFSKIRVYPQSTVSAIMQHTAPGRPDLPTTVSESLKTSKVSTALICPFSNTSACA
ncbi:hypothetical protein BDN70DRAFT_795621 [Pholiota conissans]|uniref:RING-type E3 ubiquitin transferase n=1 Tax=Pholiota conissans TaxID=109636 RepID=A0A9P5ZC48_9AGAR|nr:hypothetical protein BDN70DRAFT_795621 [Pholiota conissans]